MRWHKAPAIGHLTAAVRGAVFAFTDFITDREHFAECTARIPDHLQPAVLDRYAATHRAQGGKAANLWLLEMRETFAATGLQLASSDSDINDHAEKRAREVQKLVTDTGATTADALRSRLERYARSHGVRPPECKALQGAVARMMAARWWRRALRREIVREIEKQAVRLGLVHKRASIYASREAVTRRQDQRARIARYLAATEAENSSGQTFTLADLASKNISNPRIRRTELMVRMRGFEEFAEGAGHVGMFYTWTTPSRMHAVLAASCQPNPKHDGTTARQAQDYLVRQWAKARAKLDRAGVHVYGVRVAEPHHDGTPHWHLLLFMPAGVVAFVTATLEHYARAADAEEMDTEAARRARFHAVAIDRARGSAAGYIAKYVAKNIDAHNIAEDFEAEPGATAAATVGNVEAWAATWGIRQFQAIGGPGVGIWRELRRLREAPQLELFDGFWSAADAHTWRDFMRAMGGNAIRRRDRPLHLWRVHRDAVTQYGEDAPPVVEGVRHAVLEHCRTRFEQWEVSRGNTGAGRKNARSGNGGGASPRGMDGHEAGAGGGVAQIGNGGGVDAPLLAAIGGGERLGPGNGAGGVSGDRTSAAGLGFGVTWTRVNNCTPHDSIRNFWAQLRRDDPERAHHLWRAPGAPP